MFDATDKTSPGHYGPSQTALLILDFHKKFVQEASGPNGLAALQVAAQMRKWAQAQGIRVIHSLIDIHQTPFETCKDAARFAGVISAMRIAGGEEPAELLEGDCTPDVTFTRRPGYVSAFKSPGLQEYLHENGIGSLILTGLSTSGCVLRTAVAATDAEFVVSVISDGCADRDVDMHDMMVGKVLSNRGYVVTAKELQDAFSKTIIQGRE